MTSILFIDVKLGVIVQSNNDQMVINMSINDFFFHIVAEIEYVPPSKHLLNVLGMLYLHIRVFRLSVVKPKSK